MLPTSASPVLMPIPILISGSCSAANCWFNFFSSSCISIAAQTALVSWSGSSMGAFQNAIMQSPMNLSMVPPCLIMMSVILVRNLLISLVKPSGSPLYCSLIGVNPLMSENMKVMVLVSPPNFKSEGSFCSLATMSGDRYVPNCFFICCLSLFCVTKLLYTLWLHTTAMNSTGKLASIRKPCLTYPYQLAAITPPADSISVGMAHTTPCLGSIRISNSPISASVTISLKSALAGRSRLCPAISMSNACAVICWSVISWKGVSLR